MRHRLHRLRRPRMAGVTRGRDVFVGRAVRFAVAPEARLVLGDGCVIGERTRIVVQAGCLEIGPGAVLGERCTLVVLSRVTIGARAQLGHGATIVDFDHVFEDVERPVRLQPLRSAPITIGEGARIGLGASVLRGVAVGPWAIVDPRAVVTRDVGRGVHAGGVPAKPVAAG